VLIRPRLGSAFGSIYRREDLEHWWASAKRTLSGPSFYRPGVQCDWCPRALACPAKTEYLRTAVIAIKMANEHPTATAAMPELLQQIRSVERFCDGVKAMIRAEVKAHGGVIADDAGNEIRINVQEQKRVTFAAAWPVIEKSVPADRLDDCVTLSKTAVEKIVRDMQPSRAGKTKAAKDLFGQLIAADAFQTKFVEKMEVSYVDGQQQRSSSPAAIGFAGDAAGQLAHADCVR
jgi:hypothetical protein